MATLADTQANYGLFADATPISLAGTNKRRIGRTQQRVSYTGADILYRVKLTATASGDVATLNTVTGAVTQDTGTPSVARWTGETDNLAAKDFEGVDILAISGGDIFGFLVEVGAANDKYIALASSQDWAPDIPQIQPGFTIAALAPAGGYSGSAPYLTFTWESHASAIGDTVTVTFCAKSS
tara:strand:- start:244 stop:789 length:546 start_codon:yes stop_codon:yes gene_type:complete